MKSYQSILFFIILILSACTIDKRTNISNDNQLSNDEKENVQSTTKFDFTPNPIVVEKQDVKTLSIGDKAPDFTLPGVDNQFHSLNDFVNSDVLVIVFTCNHCPTAQAYEDRIINISDDYKSKNVQFVGISPNSPLGLLYEELGYSDLGDSFEDMKTRVEDKPYGFPYLYDGDNQRISLAYGPVATPHTFVFDKNRILKYSGRIDNSEKPGTANGEDLRNAIDAVLGNKEIGNPETKAFGCSTKWGWKTELKEKVDKEWEAKEVKLNNISEDGIKELLENNSKKLRLVNIWATWCAPCRLEFPWFVEMQRMYGARDFEFVSISADVLDKKESALKFLNSVHSVADNYIIEGLKPEELISIIDDEWKGNLPYTVLIEPGGKKVYKSFGEINFFELKKTIVENPMIGRVY